MVVTAAPVAPYPVGGEAMAWMRGGSWSLRPPGRHSRASGVPSRAWAGTAGSPSPPPSRRSRRRRRRRLITRGGGDGGGGSSTPARSRPEAQRPIATRWIRIGYGAIQSERRHGRRAGRNIDSGRRRGRTGEESGAVGHGSNPAYVRALVRIPAQAAGVTACERREHRRTSTMVYGRSGFKQTRLPVAPASVPRRPTASRAGRSRGSPGS